MDSGTNTTANTKNYINLSMNELIDAALARQEGELAANQALVVKTGKRTGRSPRDKFIVRDTLTEHQVDWNETNQPISTDRFNLLWTKATNYLEQTGTQFISYLRVGAHQTYGLPVKVISELAWHNLFAHVLFIRPDQPCLDQPKQWTLLSVANFKPDGPRDGVSGDAAIILDFTQRKILICGTHYAGEMKKAMFSVLNFILPEHDILPMHCAANASLEGDTALFFGLSGTGKTTLSADPARLLIGDDEHGWGDFGIFNFEGGCYAKCIDLSQEKEPLIWDAIRYGSVIENVILDPVTKQPAYSDASLTQNTRAAYPREFIKQRVLSNEGRQPSSVLFLTCDLYGVLPPVAKLTDLQAAYYFLSGYTALVGSTEVGAGKGIKPTFSTCFGAPFFSRPAKVYASLLMKRLKNHDTDVYLVNTGWTGGAHGQGGERFSIPTTRAIVSAILNGELKNADYDVLPGFNLAIPTHLSNIDAKLLNPSKNWPDPSAYQRNARTLITQFIENFKRFEIDRDIVQAGPYLPE